MYCCTMLYWQEPDADQSSAGLFSQLTNGIGDVDSARLQRVKQRRTQVTQTVVDERQLWRSVT